MKQVDDESNSKENGDKRKDKSNIDDNDYSQINNYNENNNTRESINENTTLIDSISKG